MNMDSCVDHKKVNASLGEAAVDTTRLSARESATLLRALEGGDREELFRAMWERDAGRASILLLEMQEQEALELICGLCLRNMESESWEARNSSLLRQLTISVPHLVQEIRNYVYEISTAASSGTERVSFIKGEGGLNLNASMTRFLRVSLFRRTKLTSRGSRPLSYREGAGGEEHVRATFREGAVKWKVSLASGALEREIKVKEPVSILDNFVWHHFSMLLARYDESRGGNQKVMVFIPSMGKEIQCSICFEGRRRIAMKNGDVMKARYYTVDLQGKAFVEIWINDAGSALLLCEKRQGLTVIGEELSD